MSNDIADFGKQAGVDLINAFKGSRLQQSLGASLAVVPVALDSFEKRLKFWKSSEYGLANGLSEQLMEAMQQVIQGNLNFDTEPQVQSMYLCEDLEAGFGYQESLGRNSTVQINIESNVSAYKCRSLQELATADYVLRFKVSASVEEMNTRIGYGTCLDQPIPWAATLSEPSGAGRKLTPLPFLRQVLKQNSPLKIEDALALYEVFCGFRLCPGLLNKQEALCEVLRIEGKRIALVGNESLALKAFPLDPLELEIEPISEKDWARFLIHLDAWQKAYAEKSGFTVINSTAQLSAGYVKLDESKKITPVFTFNNANALLLNPMSSAPLKSWLSGS